MSEAFNDAIMNNLGWLGFDGAFNERLYKYLEDLGYSGALPDMARDFGGWNAVYDTVYPNASRSFRTNAATSDYIQLGSLVTLPGDFTIDMYCEFKSTGGFLLTDYNVTTLSRCTLTSSGSLLLTVGGDNVSVDIGAGGLVNDGGLHRLTISRVSGDITARVDSGTPTFLLTKAGSFSFDRVQSKWSAATSFPDYAGIIADLRVFSDGELMHYWKINEGSGSSVYDTVGGVTGTVVNGQESDWELYEHEPSSDKWVGTTSSKELVVTY